MTPDGGENSEAETPSEKLHCENAIYMCVCVLRLWDDFGPEEVGNERSDDFRVVEVDVVISWHGHHRVLSKERR